MSQIWKDDKVIPITLIQAGPVVITQIRTKDKDGYEAVQIGFESAKKTSKNSPKFRHLKEFKIDGSELNIGDNLDVGQFNEGDKVRVSGFDKGRGFQGVVKRHGFHGGPKTHGQKNRGRAPGSIGATAPQRVMPNKRMAGRMGHERNTIKNVKVVGIDKGKNILMLKGAVPGRKGTLLEISNS